MPWEILNLDKESASEREVKRAYARLLRQHRPDKDPEGFKRVHEAYTQALLQLEWKNQADYYDDDHIDDGPLKLEETDHPKMVHEVDPLSASAFAAETRIGTAEELKLLEEALNAGELNSVSEEYIALEKMLYAHPGLFAEFSGSLYNLAELNPELFYQALPASVAITELIEGDATLASGLIERHLLEDDYSQLIELGETLVRKQDLMRSPAAGRVVTRLAGELAIPSPDLAERLLDIAYESLPSDERGWLISGVEQQVMEGRVFTHFAPEMRAFWAKCFRAPDGEDWDKEENHTALHYLTENVDPEWPGYARIDEAFPDRVRTFVTRRRNAKRQGIYNEKSGGVKGSFDTENNSSSWGCAIIVLILSLIHI